jgi:predicted nucleotidyltransferase
MKTVTTELGNASLNAKLRALLGELRRRFELLYGGRLVTLVLYGSHARGDAETGSDIDILVVLKGSVQPGTEVERTGEIISELSLQFDEVISCIFVNQEIPPPKESPVTERPQGRGRGRVTDEQRDLLAHAQDSIGAAKVLLQSGYPGFSASRSYYACFTSRRCFCWNGVWRFPSTQP